MKLNNNIVSRGLNKYIVTNKFLTLNRLIMDKVFSFQQAFAGGTVFPVPFSTVARQFLNAIDKRAGGRYFHRWASGGETLDSVFSDFLIREIQALPLKQEDYHQILEALIVYLEGGSYDKILEADSRELFGKYKRELTELLPGSVPGVSTIIFCNPSQNWVDTLAKNGWPENRLPDPLEGVYGSGSPGDGGFGDSQLPI